MVLVARLLATEFAKYVTDNHKPLESDPVA